jgi:hypothetical protein
MANLEHLEILKRGVLHWNQWREKRRVVTPDLGGASAERIFAAQISTERISQRQSSAPISAGQTSGTLCFAGRTFAARDSEARTGAEQRHRVPQTRLLDVQEHGIEGAKLRNRTTKSRWGSRRDGMRPRVN